MGDVFQKFVPGQPLGGLRAEQANAWTDAAIAERRRLMSHGFDVVGRRRSSTTIEVRNMTGATLDRFAVTVLTEPAIEPAENLNEALADPIMDVEAPGTSFANEPIVILEAPLNAETVGRGVIMGATWAQVYVNGGEESLTHACVSSGVTSYLAMATSGPVRVLWKESGTGLKWAYVLLCGCYDVPIA